MGESGQIIKGHEFHYWDSTDNGKDCVAKKPGNGKTYDCMFHTDSMLAGFAHLYYQSAPMMVFRFLKQCKRYQAGRLAKMHWDRIAKPIDSLGLLETYIVKLCRIYESPMPHDLKKRAVVVFCADHGVVSEGVTQTGQEVTQIVSENFAKGKSTVNRMAGVAGADVYVVDVGMKTDPYPEKNLVMGAVVDRKVAKGSANLAVRAAMTGEQCRQAVETGMELVKELKEKGYQILAAGEMGIGNTTPTSALAAWFLEKSPREVTGKGAGLSKEGLERKIAVIERVYQRMKEKQLTDPFDVLAEAGGLEIAAMTGFYLGAVKHQMPVILDGAISVVAALVANRIDSRVADYLLASHQSAEPVGRLALAALGQEAILHGKMCLGEGTGAMALLPLLDMAMEVYRNMGSFADYEIQAYERME